ncbi:MAG: leucine-rich repeat domain-containing protein [Candidatus Thorarchaeota archaeon]
MELTPDKIYKDFLKNNLDKPSATKLLLSLIENSENDKFRADCIKELDHIGVRDRLTFKFLENLLISDSNEIIRNCAAVALRNNFFDRILEPMKWALIHEESPSCLNTIYSTLIKIIHDLAFNPNPLAKLTLLTEIKKIRRKEFKLGFEIFCETKEINDFTKNDLCEILVNYFTIIFLEKSFWRLKFRIENCKIVELDFIFKGLTSLPIAIKNLTHLKKLILRYNQLTKLPDWLGSLLSLEELNINVNNLNEITSSIGMLSSLRELLLWKNELTYLPHTIGKLSSLELLNVRLNQLKVLPDSIANLSLLKELNLHDNQLIYLPESLQGLISLEKLNLSWNHIELIPDSLGYLPSLKFLYLERNELIYLPESIGYLLSLEFLNLSDNKLKRIPDIIGNLSSLHYLNLSRNDLDSIPESIGSLNSLRELYIGENNIRVIPKNLKRLEHSGLKIYY